MSESSDRSGSPQIALAFASCALIWGTTFLVISIGNDTVPPMWAGFLRLVIASLVMVAVVRLGGRRLPTGPALRVAAIYGVFLFGINLPLLYWGETVVPSGLAAVMYATTPISGALVARLFGIERLDPLKLLGALVALGGVALLFARDLAVPATALPLLAIFIATVAGAIGSTIFKRGPKQDAMAANAIAAAAGAPFCLAGSFLLHETRQMPTHLAQILPIIYLALAGSVGAFVIFSWLVRRVPVSTAAFVGVVVPVIAVTLGTLVRHERFAREHVFGSMLVLAGLFVAIVSDRRSHAASTGH